MRFVRVHPSMTACAAVFAFFGVIAESAFAQAPGQPGQPQVQVNGQNVVVSFAPSGPPAATGYAIAATLNGVTIPGSPFFIGGATSVPAGPLATGSYTIQVIAINGSGQTASLPTTFVIGGGGGPLATPTMASPTVTGDTVTLNWTPDPNATGYDVEATVQATGQIITLPVGNQTSLTVPGVPLGNFIVRVRARNAFGVSPFSNQVLVVVGLVLGQGDMQVTLTWNSTADIDLHVIEPDGSHVYFSAKTGTTSRLDVDDTNGFGPENIFVGSGGALPGVYQIFIVHFSGDVPTTSTIAMTLGAGTANPQTAFFTRQTTAGDVSTGFNVASVNVITRQVVETVGARAADQRGAVTKKEQ